MKIIIGLALLILVIPAAVFIRKRMSDTDPDREIEKNYTRRMMSRYK